MSDGNAASLAEMDAQINYHETRALSLKIQRNKRAPVSKLSQDVLLAIFLTARDSEQDQNLSNIPLRITHVCKEWRYVAIEAATLWIRPPTHHCRLQWTEITLQRAKMAPLDVLLDFDHSSPATNKLVLASMSRIAKLVIKGMSHRLYSLSGLISDNAPQLQELQISREIFEEDLLHLEDSDFEDTNFLKLVLPPTAFQEAPKLRRLTLQHVDLDFNSTLLSNLSSLSLKNVSPSALPTWAQLTDALRRMPLLQELSLDWALPPAAASMPDLKAIELRHLKAISVRTKAVSQLQTFLSFIIVAPPLVSLSLAWTFNNTPGDSQTESIIRTAAHLTDAKKHGDSFTTLDISAERDNKEIRSLARSPEGCFIEIAFPATNDPDDEWRDIHALKDFTRILLLNRITYLSLDTDWIDYDVDSLRVLLNELPLLQTATIGRLSAFNFFDCLDAEIRSKVVDKFCLRELKSITWRDTDFRRYEWWVEERAAYILEDRQKEGIPLQELTFRNIANLNAELVEIFKEVVPKVVVEPAL
ncbi:hypothetical protein D9619_006178 [Psilocybe cf. subviscida]|uniref:F-box domain-containing protein n=1 Tax=Psilocybe cf. subviscida TaxID=2480587 RepID=A0A8H5B3Z6_9AGAR|nr:hypothetical protein D9619_006178 [Psilocybe cf. subviscida]